MVDEVAALSDIKQAAVEMRVHDHLLYLASSSRHDARHAMRIPLVENLGLTV